MGILHIKRIATWVIMLTIAIKYGLSFEIGHPRYRRSISAKGRTAEDELDLTESQNDAFKKLKEDVMKDIVFPLMRKDIYLVKFLIAHDYNADFAGLAVKSAIAWRKDFYIDDIGSEDLSKGRRRFEANTEAVDMQGRVVLYMQTGKWELKNAIKHGEGNVFERTLYQLFEESTVKTLKKYEKDGKKNAQFDVLFNYDEWTTESGACLECVAVATKVAINFDSKWPVFFHKVILVNTATDFGLFLDMIRLVISKDTNKKIEVFGRNKNQWYTELSSNLIEAKQLEKALNDKADAFLH